MKKLFIFSLICILSGFLTVACERDRGVQAAREGGTDTYQPRHAPKGPAPKGEVMPDKNEMKGELIRIDMAKKTITIRAENGMEQTFKFGDDTAVMGVEHKQPVDKKNMSQVRNLVGKEGSEISVKWRDEGGAKTATTIDVTDVVVKNDKAKRKTGRY